VLMIESVGEVVETGEAGDRPHITAQLIVTIATVFQPFMTLLIPPVQ